MLENDARLTAAQIAAALGSVEKTVSAMIEELENEGVIAGYKAIINCKIKNKAGQYIDKKMIAVMYLNKDNNLWCVEMFRESIDPNKEHQTLKQDVDSGKFYTKKQYVYRSLAYWAISSGKLNEAIKYMNIAEEEAAKVNDTKFNIDSQKEVLRKII